MAKNKKALKQQQKEEIKKAKSDAKRSIQNAKNAQKKKASRKNLNIQQSMQSFSPIKDLRNGIIITKDDRYIKIMEFSPINFELRSAREQDLIIGSFMAVLKQCPAKVQFKVLSKKADIEKYVEKLEKQRNLEQNFECKKLQKEHIDMIKEVSTNEGVSRRFFIIFEFVPMNPNRSYNFNEIKFSLETTAGRIASVMYQCGNEIIEPDNEDEYVLELLYGIFSRKDSEENSFENRMLATVAQYVASGISGDSGKIPYIPVNDLICPEYIDFRKHKYIIIDGIYYAFAYIPGQAYPPQAYPGWLSPLINIGEGIDIDFFLNLQPKERIQRKLGQKLRINNSKIKNKQDTNTDFDDLESAIGSGYYMKAGIAGGEDFYYMNTLITITADSKEYLEWKIGEIEACMINMDIAIKMCNYQGEQAFLSTLPICNLDKNLYSKSKRNVLTSGAAASYPFTSFEMSDENGILLGINKSNNSLVIVDMFNSKKYKNANMAILGTSGAGKTFTMQCMALRMRQKQIQTFIIAPLKGHEFKRACESVGGQYVKISAGSQQCINIMEIRKKDTANTDLIDGEDDANKDSILSQKIQNIHIFFSLLTNDITIEEKQLLDEACIKTYALKGITTDNDSLIDPNNPSKYKEMPTLGDLYAVLRGNPETHRLATIINRYVSGSASSFNNQTNVDLNNKYIVLDISSLTKEMLPIGMFVALDYVWDKAKEDRTAKKAIFIDETWNLIGGSSNALAAEFVLEIFKIIRGYGGSAIAATQDLNDFFALEGGKYGKGIINNAKTKIILNLEQEEADRVQDTLNLTDSEAQNIVKFQRGNGLISTNSNNVLVEFKASPMEVELITTDRAELEKIANDRRSNTGGMFY